MADKLLFIIAENFFLLVTITWVIELVALSLIMKNRVKFFAALFISLLFALGTVCGIMSMLIVRELLSIILFGILLTLVIRLLMGRRKLG